MYGCWGLGFSDRDFRVDVWCLVFGVGDLGISEFGGWFVGWGEGIWGLSGGSSDVG